MCPFVSVGTGNRSEWCDLFDDLDAFGGYEYWGSLDKYYNTGYVYAPPPMLQYTICRRCAYPVAAFCVATASRWAP